ncbi:MAG: PSP1 domain-containing protein [Bacteroidota bacterium]
MENIDLIDRGVCKSKAGPCGKLRVFDWLSDVKSIANPEQVVEVRFKNTRKDYFRNVNNLALIPGDIVAVEANPGHDIGVVSLTGELVYEQMYKHKASYINGELRKVYRKAKPVDTDKWKEAILLEHQTMIKSRQIAADLRLDMKIGDVEYQGDKTKAIFYYIADERVDFRQLIKILAEEFRIRIEMKQIGARQEAGRIGGIGPCGRELCCSSWMCNFVSVTTNSARYQDLTMNPQKLAGQCGKLKCCLNYEIDTYLDAQKDFPPSGIPLETEKGRYVFQKADILRGVFWYSLQNESSSLIPVTVANVREIQKLNKKGKKPDKLTADMQITVKNEAESFQNMAGQESLSRFDKGDPRKRKKFSKKGPGRRNR